MRFSRYAKTAVATLAAAAVALSAALTDNTVTAAEWVTVALAALGALGVYAIPNRAREQDAPARYDGPAPRSMDLP